MQIRKNISLIIGISIPILMVVLVAASIYGPGFFAPPPRFNFLYTDGSDGEGFRYAVNSGKLTKREVQPPRHYIPRETRLFVHDVAANRSIEVSFTEAQQFTLITNPISPDGWEVVHGSTGGGAFPLFFYHDTDYNSMYLKGHHTSRKLKIQSLNRWRYYSGGQFLGWIQP